MSVYMCLHTHIDAFTNIWFIQKNNFCIVMVTETEVEITWVTLCSWTERLPFIGISNLAYSYNDVKPVLT